VNESSPKSSIPTAVTISSFSGLTRSVHRLHHNYLTLVTNHETGKIVYGAEGKSANELR